MVLQRVIRKVLLPLGEHHAVDLGFGAVADQGHVLIDLGQSAAQGGDGPLQPAVAVNDAVLMGKVPDVRRPVLQIDIPQPRAGADEQFDGAAVQAWRRMVEAQRLGQQRGFGSFLEHDQRVPQIGCAGG